MKNKLSTLLCLLFPLFSFAQITFEKSYQNINDKEVAVSATEDGNGGYVLAAGRKRNSPTFIDTLGILHMNAYGDTIWYNKFIIGYRPEVKLIRKTTDGYVVLGIADDSAQINTWMLWINKFDTRGTLVWSKYFSDSLDICSEDGIALEVAANGNLFLYTVCQFVSLDSSGTILNANYTYYANIFNDFENLKLILKNSLYNITSFYSPTGLPPFKSKILKFNENADTIGSLPIVLDSARRSPRILKALPNGFLIGGFSYYSNKLFLSKIDSTGNKIWDKLIPNKTFLNSYFTSNSLLKNGNIIISGFPKYTGSAPPLLHKAWLYCFNENGDSLWYKEFRADSLHRTEFFDVIATADSGLLACGQISMPDSSLRSYIVKLDENGNLFNPLSVIERTKETYLHVFPNPANNSTSIHYMGTEKDVVLSITNLQGHLVFSQKLRSNDERILINTALFKSGIYLCTIHSKRKMSARKKLVVLN
ncbi:MAG: T9SS type A sorting domain-containing protein [Bacteroidetes bacterium]|nr:T9SS type A sorting domain-containing protein [Bacteroidota bacterium]